MNIFPFKLNGKWGYVERNIDLPAGSSVTWEQDFSDLSDDEKRYLTMECLSFDEDSKTATFNRDYFNTHVRNQLYIDDTTDDGKQIKWLDERIAAYPSIGDQMDMMFKDQINGTATWKDAVNAAKTSTPKPT
tara:strand:+ start:608 stop:1003 length:396 start_codon:yes stop_codon:yes gene_type:complete